MMAKRRLEGLAIARIIINEQHRWAIKRLLVKGKSRHVVIRWWGVLRSWAQRVQSNVLIICS